MSTSKEAIQKAYEAGVQRGITMYAWWKDGTQYVGSGSRTLKKAYEEDIPGIDLPPEVEGLIDNENPTS